MAVPCLRSSTIWLRRPTRPWALTQLACLAAAAGRSASADAPGLIADGNSRKIKCVDAWMGAESALFKIPGLRAIVATAGRLGFLMRESEAASRLVDGLYAAALDVDLWPNVLEQFSRVFEGSSAHLSVENSASTRGRMISFGTDPRYAERYGDYYITRNVLWQRFVQQPRAGIFTDRDLMPKDELRRSEFYNDFLRPQEGEELLISVFERSPASAKTITLWRPKQLGPWHSRHMKLLALFTPHLRRALNLSEQVGCFRIMNELAAEALYQLDQGIIFVDSSAAVLFMNKKAEATLREGRGLRLVRNRLFARRTAETTALHKLIVETTQDIGALAISREERLPLLISVVPVRSRAQAALHNWPCAVLLVKDPEQPAKCALNAFGDYFGLTPAQLAVANELMQGDGLIRAASRLGISHTTARTHLIQVFKKTATQRQAELVRLMSQWTQIPQ
jgi:DNA-binding CsgD family transcriptional regulator